MILKIKHFFLLTTLATFGQNNDAEFIKSVKIEAEDTQFSNTVQRLHKSITFSFDDINANQDEYYYKITHCEIDWTPSNLPTSYYIDGFHNFQINNFENSFGTLQNYTHYSFTLPNEDTRITKSGNYLIEILDEYDDVVCQRQLTLFENKVAVGIKISESRDLKNLNKKQAVSLVLNTQNIVVNYPEEEIKTFIYQNGDQQIRTPFLTPTFTDRNMYTYRPTEEMEFNAGNEYYYFDNNELLRNSRFVANSFRDDTFFRSILFSKQSRAYDIYKYNPDINGAFVFRNANSNNTNTEADYSMVQFSLENDEDFYDKELYVYGAFNNFKFTPENKLTLDKTGKFLIANIYLKQGFYNYDFVAKGETIDKTIVSGSFFQTENNYECLVYYQPLNERYYEVLGYGVANSKQQIEN